MLSKSLITFIPLKAALGLFAFGAFRAENTLDMATASFKAATSLGGKTFSTRQ